MKIGVISDTHGYLNPKVFDLFSGVEQILHAGDIGSEDVITGLEVIAPVVAVHGNVDRYPLAHRYPAAQALTIAEVGIVIVHDIADLETERVRKLFDRLPKGRPDLVIYGHSHIARVHRQGETVLFNPGAAGKARLKSRPSVGLLEISAPGRFETQTLSLQ
jgi:putative phosphoesterase